MAYAQVFYGPDQPLGARDVPLPSSLQAGQVLAEIALATICGSDLHTISGHRPERTPCILGHEAVGRVVALGSGRPELRIGDRITWSIADSCGSCVACSDYELPEKCANLFK
ncbi:MAG: alcohol dehydrogenase catalytic domain-containing protein, partial [Candidatus Latescibacterota bacterium]